MKMIIEPHGDCPGIECDDGEWAVCYTYPNGDCACMCVSLKESEDDDGGELIIVESSSGSSRRLRAGPNSRIKIRGARKMPLLAAASVLEKILPGRIAVPVARRNKMVKFQFPATTVSAVARSLGLVIMKK